jgi:hypothetical protein
MMCKPAHLMNRKNSEKPRLLIVNKADATIYPIEFSGSRLSYVVGSNAFCVFALSIVGHISYARPEYETGGTNYRQLAAGLQTTQIGG